MAPTKDERRAWIAMGRKLYDRRRITYNMERQKKRGTSYRDKWEESGSTLSFEDWLKENGIYK